MTNKTLKSDPKNLRIFGLTLPAVIVFWSLLAMWAADISFIRLWPAWLVCILLLVFAVFAPLRLQPLFRVWMIFAGFLNHVINGFLLGMIFFLLITPVALLARLLGHDALKNKEFLPNSYRIRSKPITGDDMEHPF